MSGVCERLATDLVAYLDGELAPERAREIEAHLERCAACRRECEALRWSYEELAAWQPESSRGDAARRVRERLEATGPRRRGGWGWLAAAAAVAAAVLLWVVAVRPTPGGGREGAAVATTHGRSEPGRWEPVTVPVGSRAEPVRVAARDTRPKPQVVAPDAAPAEDNREVASAGGQDGAQPGAPAARVEGTEFVQRDGPVAAEPVDPELEREAIAALDVLEALDDVEMVEVLDALEDLDDPVWLLSEDGESG